MAKDTGTAYFQGKTALVMGATGGLGSAVARALTAHGATVIAAGRDRAKLDRLVAEQGAQRAYPSDLTVPDQIIALREFAVAQYGAIDVVINASGADARKPLEAHTPDEVRRMLDVNLGGVIGLTQGALPIMRDSGVMVHVGGFADGRLAFPYYSADVATRAGVAAFVEAINRELALEGRAVIVSYFSPSPTDTEAERPFHPIWREMGVKIEPLGAVVAELLTAIQRRERLHIMGGFTTRLFAKLNAAWPQLTDRLMMKRYGRILRKHLLNVNEPPKPRSNWLRWLGIGLIAISFGLYGVLFSVPFWPIETGAKVALSPALIGSSEVAFWIGGLLIGKEVITRLRRYLDPRTWCRSER